MLLIAAACAGDSREEVSGNACTSPEVAAVVERFGASLRQVSLLAPDSLRDGEMREAYAELVTPELLERWTTDPTGAPGREVSSPWPERIEISSASPAAQGCRVEGEVVYVTSSEAGTGAGAARLPVTVELRRMEAGWRISDYRAAPR
jgi:hypothetical protein